MSKLCTQKAVCHQQKTTALRVLGASIQLRKPTMLHSLLLKTRCALAALSLLLAARPAAAQVPTNDPRAA